MIPWLDPLILQNAFRRSHPSEEYIEQTSRKRRDLRRTKESAFNAGDPGSIPGSGRFPWRRDRLPTPVFLGFPVAQMVKNLSALRETWIQSLWWEDPLEKETPLLYSDLENSTDCGVGHD